MADTLPNVGLPRNVWVNLYATTGVPVGTKILVENLGSVPVKVVTSSSEPTEEVPSGFQYIHQRTQKVNDEGDSGAWALTTEEIGLLNIQVVPTV